MQGTHTVPENILIALAAISLCAILAHHFMARCGLRRCPATQRNERSRELSPPISVLKPLCGVDEGLYENLLSIVNQDYPSFEVVFGVTDARDPALAVVARVMREKTRANMRVVVRAASANVANPKIANLLNMLRVASHEHILISDSNVRAAPDYLEQLAVAMSEPDVGLVSNLIVGDGEQSLGASLENLHLNTFVAGSVCMGAWVGRVCVIGKSMLMRRSEIDALGGLASMSDVLAEDYVLGQRYTSAGHRVLLSRQPVVAHNQRLPIRRFAQRHLRWAQLRRWVAPDAFMFEPVLYSTPWLIAPAVYAGTSSPHVTLACAMLVLARVLSDAWLAQAISGKVPALRVLALVPLKDCVLLAVWCIALFRRSIEWRGHRMWIGAGSIVSPITRAATRVGAGAATAIR